MGDAAPSYSSGSSEVIVFAADVAAVVVVPVCSDGVGRDEAGLRASLDTRWRAVRAVKGARATSRAGGGGVRAKIITV